MIVNLVRKFIQIKGAKNKLKEGNKNVLWDQNHGSEIAAYSTVKKCYSSSMISH